MYAPANQRALIGPNQGTTLTTTTKPLCLLPRAPLRRQSPPKLCFPRPALTARIRRQANSRAQRRLSQRRRSRHLARAAPPRYLVVRSRRVGGMMMGALADSRLLDQAMISRPITLYLFLTIDLM